MRINVFRLEKVGRLIHLVEHTGGARRDNLTQVIFSFHPAGDIYIDQVFFMKATNVLCQLL